jgi:choline dehydrogenase
LDGLQELGIPILTDPNNGTAAGGMLIPNNISPDNQTRSYTRLDYYDGFIDSRPNFHVMTHRHVTRVLINAQSAPISPRDYPAGLWAAGVEYLTDGTLAAHNISCSREIILAAGAVHTPQILEMSGIGDLNVLSQFNVPAVINLPGVGNNFQDHPYVGIAHFCKQFYYFLSDS